MVQTFSEIQQTTKILVFKILDYTYLLEEMSTKPPVVSILHRTLQRVTQLSDRQFMVNHIYHPSPAV